MTDERIVFDGMDMLPIPVAHEELALMYDVNCVVTASVEKAIDSTARELSCHIFKPGERSVFAL